jgi:hypothetical protein
MQPWGKVSSIPEANTRFEGWQTQRQRHIEETDRDRRDTEIKIL